MKICMDCLYAWEPTHCFNPLHGYHQCESCNRAYMQCMASVLEPGEEPDTEELEEAIIDLAKAGGFKNE